MRLRFGCVLKQVSHVSCVLNRWQSGPAFCVLKLRSGRALLPSDGFSELRLSCVSRRCVLLSAFHATLRLAPGAEAVSAWLLNLSRTEQGSVPEKPDTSKADCRFHLASHSSICML